MIRYADIRDDLATGDIVLFSGRGVISAGIKVFTGSRWSHVGMVVRPADLEVVLVWESTTLSDVPDFETAKATRGVQLVSLSDRIATYPGTVAIRRLSERVSPGALRALGRLRGQLAGRQYEQHWLDLLCADFRDYGRIEPDFSSFFCSELVALAYQRMHLIPEVPHAGRFVPADFSFGRSTVDSLLRRGTSLAREVEVSYAP